MTASGGELTLRSGTLGGLLGEVAERYSRHDAVVFEGDRLDYSQLDQAVTAVAKGLLALGLRRGDRVAALLDNRPEWLVLFFAVARIGATSVPLNTWYKASELGYVLRHSRPVLLVALPRLLDIEFDRVVLQLVPELEHSEPGELRSRSYPWLRTVVLLGHRQSGTLAWDDLVSLGRSVSDDVLHASAAQVSPEDLALILYTSGSTARPKAVTLVHRGIVKNGFDIGERRWITSDDRVWLGAPLFYALGAVNGMPAAVTHGAAIVLQGHFDAGRALDVIEQERCSVYYGVGLMTRRILAHPKYDRSRVRSLEKGNAGISAEDKRLSLVELGLRLATCSYGLTETYGNCTGGLPDEPLDTKIETAGLPLPGFELSVVDPANGRPLPNGEVGLLKLRGYVTPGYMDDPAADRQVFDSDGFFDTGDLGSLGTDGRWRFHSRLKEVIKTSGVNVSPFEVETLLMAHPSVREAHVVGVPDLAYGELMVAFVETSEPVAEEQIRSFVRGRAASFKVPHHLFFATDGELPRLASGKVSGPGLREAAKRRLRARAT